jgi:hypothetical protein
MGMFDVSEETVREYKAKFRAMAEEAVDEPVIAVGPFRRGGASASFAASKMGGGLAYAAVSLGRKKSAGGLPENIFLIVTPSKLHAFKYGMRGRNYRLKDEVAVWDRADLEISTEMKSGLTMLTIESSTEGEKATLAPGGVKDDAFSQEVIDALTNGGDGAAA